MDFLQNNALTKALIYWKDKTILDRYVNIQIYHVESKMTSFLEDIQTLSGKISAENTALESFADWETRYTLLSRF
jgi:hypothetical protein